jgi:hypothetical protein
MPSIYTRELFATGYDTANRAAVAAMPTEALDLVALGLHAHSKAADKLVKGCAASVTVGRGSAPLLSLSQGSATDSDGCILEPLHAQPPCPAH